MRQALPLVLAAVVTACVGPPADVPSAVILITPGSVCELDAFATAVVLDARQSSPHLTLVPTAPDPGEPPLEIRWRLDGAETAIESGDLESERLVVRTSGERPLHVTLTVTNGEGGSATSVRTLSITVPDHSTCALDDECLEQERCLRDESGEGVCVPNSACETDADCEACFVCDVGGAVCVPRSGS